MTRFILLISIIFLITTGCSKKTDEKYFEKTFITAFKHQDFSEFKKIIITPQDLAAGLSSNSMNGLPNNKDLVDEYRQTYINDYKKLFDQIINQGKALGIDWNMIKFENLLYKINDPIAGSGLHLMNCHINIKVKDKNYCFYGIDAQEYTTGYKISYIIAIKRGRLEKYIDSNNNPEPTL